MARDFTSISPKIMGDWSGLITPFKGDFDKKKAIEEIDNYIESAEVYAAEINKAIDNNPALRGWREKINNSIVSDGANKWLTRFTQQPGQCGGWHRTDYELGCCEPPLYLRFLRAGADLADGGDLDTRIQAIGDDDDLLIIAGLKKAQLQAERTRVRNAGLAA
ncbi:12661_t:CDS:2 [Ambispora leptoticha]|uniref:12661_t:CDS:1 n=1 Tax=Ambispora leptoticha TaxID=144679 RepID=A0A9N9I9D7_9GLOM|nr:12661_t:CDS:2 [Ambispora leptoticha]